MATATVNNAKFQSKIVKRIDGALRNLEDGVGTILGLAIPMIFEDSFVIPATSVDDNNDINRLWTFPSGAFITDFRGTPSDMDSGANLVYSILTTDTADVTKVTIVSGSTKAQAASGSDRILDAAVGKFVGDQILAFKATTGAAGGALAGTYKVYIAFAIGVNNFDAGNKPRMTDPSI